MSRCLSLLYGQEAKNAVASPCLEDALKPAIKRRKRVFHAAPGVVELYPGFHVQYHQNFTNFLPVKEGLNVCMAVSCVTVASKTC